MLGDDSPRRDFLAGSLEGSEWEHIRQAEPTEAESQPFVIEWHEAVDIDWEGFDFQFPQD